MLWTSAFLLALAVAQVPAKSAKYLQADYIENVSDSDSRIVSGWEASPGQHPHHANLRMTNAQGVVSSCGASVVHKDWVLTAAHCTAMQMFIIIRAGLVRLHDAQYVTESRRWHNHPSFVDQWVHIVQPNDIALISLPQSIAKFTDLLKPIRMQSRNDAFRDYGSQVLYASGHGRTWTGGNTAEALQWVYLRGVSNLPCQRLFGGIITSNTICAQFFNMSSQSTCHGDSGGPLVFLEQGAPALVGVTSFVAGEQSGGCHSGHPAGFIRTGPFHNWFTDVTGIDFEYVDVDVPTTLPTEQLSTSESPPETTWPTPGPTWAPSTWAPSTWAPSTWAPSTWAPSTWAPSTWAPSTWAPSTWAPSTWDPSTWAPSTWAPSTWAPSTWAPSTWAPSTWAPSTWAPSTWAPSTWAPTWATTTWAPVTEQEPDVDSEEDKPSSEEDSDSESEEDPELSELLKKLEVQVKVKVKLSKYGSHKEIHHNKTVSHNRHH